jgi:predicted DNA-binding antitoxin AbrB/MazE fold protein
MEVQVEAVYEGGVLKLGQPLPLPEGQRVEVVVKVKTSRVKQAYGLLGFTGDPSIIRQIALDPDFGVQESP